MASTRPHALPRVISSNASDAIIIDRSGSSVRSILLNDAVKVLGSASLPMTDARITLNADADAPMKPVTKRQLDAVSTFTQAGTGAQARTGQDKARERIHVLDFIPSGTAIDGTVDLRAYIEFALARAKAIADQFTVASKYRGAFVELDFTGVVAGMTPGVSGHGLNLNSHAYITLKNPSMKAVGSWTETNFMIYAGGASYNSNSHLRIENPTIDCDKKCQGIFIQNAPRFELLKPSITHFKTRGLVLGQSIWLGRADGGGAIHEWDDGDANQLVTGAYEATGVEILSGAGDFFFDLNVGWCDTCVDNNGSGVIVLGGHWYASMPVAGGRLGRIYVHRNNGSYTTIRKAYLDTGSIDYYGGNLKFASDCEFFVNGTYAPASLTAYINMIASTTGQYHFISLANPHFANRTFPRVKKTETGGTWANVPDTWLAGSKDIVSGIDEINLSVAAAVNTPVRVTTEGVTGSYVAFTDGATTNAPQIGSNGDNFEVYISGTKRVEVTGTFVNTTTNLHRDGVQILAARQTGWGTPSGPYTKTAFDPSTVTLPQLAERVGAVIDALRTHGLIGD